MTLSAPRSTGWEGRAAELLLLPGPPASLVGLWVGELGVLGFCKLAGFFLLDLFALHKMEPDWRGDREGAASPNPQELLTKRTEDEPLGPGRQEHTPWGLEESF